MLPNWNKGKARAAASVGRSALASPTSRRTEGTGLLIKSSSVGPQNGPEPGMIEPYNPLTPPTSCTTPRTTLTKKAAITHPQSNRTCCNRSL